MSTQSGRDLCETSRHDFDEGGSPTCLRCGEPAPTPEPYYLGTAETFYTLYGPDGFEVTADPSGGAPEDLIWSRDLREVVNRLNQQQADLDVLRSQAEQAESQLQAAREENRQLRIASRVREDYPVRCDSCAALEREQTVANTLDAKRWRAVRALWSPFGGEAGCPRWFVAHLPREGVDDVESAIDRLAARSGAPPQEEKHAGS